MSDILKRHQILILDNDADCALAQRVSNGALLFNAPRPLYGDFEFVDEFRHGRYYAVVNADSERREWMIKENLSLDAWLIKFITPEAAQAIVRARLDKYKRGEYTEAEFSEHWRTSFYSVDAVREIQQTDLEVQP